VGRIADPQQVAAYFQAANWYVHASKADTFPNSILEAMACATPVIASSVGGIPEQVQNEKTGLLVEPRDAAALAEALQRVLTQPEMGVAMGAAALERVQALYTLEKQAQAYLDWFTAIQKPR
jgi:glycosyltransferase involved in cell wall biosynthesis